jgi:hypothetical protein
MDGLAGYDYVFYPGATMNSNKVKIFQQGASAGPFPELAAGAYPTAITADTITFYGIFKKLHSPPTRSRLIKRRSRAPYLCLLKRLHRCR